MAARYSSVDTLTDPATLTLGREVVIICTNPDDGTGSNRNISKVQLQAKE
jgi:hypothetical protein